MLKRSCLLWLSLSFSSACGTSVEDLSPDRRVSTDAGTSDGGEENDASVDASVSRADSGAELADAVGSDRTDFDAEPADAEDLDATMSDVIAVDSSFFDAEQPDLAPVDAERPDVEALDAEARDGDPGDAEQPDLLAEDGGPIDGGESLCERAYFIAETCAPGEFPLVSPDQCRGSTAAQAQCLLQFPVEGCLYLQGQFPNPGNPFFACLIEALSDAGPNDASISDASVPDLGVDDGGVADVCSEASDLLSQCGFGQIWIGANGCVDVEVTVSACVLANPGSACFWLESTLDEVLDPDHPINVCVSEAETPT